MRQYLDLLSSTTAAIKAIVPAQVHVRYLVIRCALIFPRASLYLPLKVHFRSIVIELLWFLKGDTHVKYLQDNKVTIWDEWATAEQTARFGRPEGELGPVYGHQWRNFGATQNADGSYNQDGFDQIKWLINEIKTNPNSRRLIVSGWNPNEASQVALPPCHTLFQFFVHNGKLSCQLYQRSADVFLLYPHINNAQYAELVA